MLSGTIARRSDRRLAACALLLAAAACAPWARGPQLSPAASGLVGSWIAPRQPQPPDTTLLQFGPDGCAQQLRLTTGHETRVPLGPFRVWADTGRVRLICFATRRSRSEPGCRYFEVDTLTDESGHLRRGLRFLNWVTGHGDTAPEMWTEHGP